jgi:hypothetical protein
LPEAVVAATTAAKSISAGVVADVPGRQRFHPAKHTAAIMTTAGVYGAYTIRILKNRTCRRRSLRRRPYRES